jgi:hypothetical protein
MGRGRGTSRGVAGGGGRGVAVGRKRIDLSGRTFGRWRVIRYAGRSMDGMQLWKCRCACGAVQVVRYGALLGVKQACNKCAKLAKPEYQTIARLRAAAVKQADIARWLGVSRQYVGSVVDFLENRVQSPRSKTRCPHGHRFTQKNTYRDERGWRRCRECQKIRDQKRRQRIREEQIRASLWPKPPKLLATRCKRGHEYTPDNVYLYIENGQQRRQCKTCAIAGVRARRANQRAADAVSSNRMKIPGSVLI